MDYRTINRHNWDERASAHAASRDYAVSSFVSDPSYLSRVVRFDLPLLGDISGQRGIHLQCHIATDTLSLARLGARMTGLDFSLASLAEARRLVEQTGSDIELIEGDVYDAVSLCGSMSFDFVYTGVGALCWLPGIQRWATVVSELLRPDGRLFLREGHPVLWAIDETRGDGLLVIDHPYFETDAPFVGDDAGTYVDTDVVFRSTETHQWNHGLGEIVTALLDAGMAITGLIEHQTAPWNALPGRTERLDDGEWRLKERPERLPQTYTLQAIKRRIS